MVQSLLLILVLSNAVPSDSIDESCSYSAGITAGTLAAKENNPTYEQVCFGGISGLLLPGLGCLGATAYQYTSQTSETAPPLTCDQSPDFLEGYKIAYLAERKRSAAINTAIGGSVGSVVGVAAYFVLWTAANVAFMIFAISSNAP